MYALEYIYSILHHYLPLVHSVPAYTTPNPSFLSLLLLSSRQHQHPNQLTLRRYHLLAKARNYHGFDYELMSTVKILSATPKGEVEFELVSDEKYGNLNRVMHGGAAALIFDMCTTSALGPLAKPGYWE
jgi:hypothetical protein